MNEWLKYFLNYFLPKLYNENLCLILKIYEHQRDQKESISEKEPFWLPDPICGYFDSVRIGYVVYLFPTVVCPWDKKSRGCV